jgi:putative intracellular protease/amidase
MKKTAIFLSLFAFFILPATAQDQTGQTSGKPVRVLLLMDDDYGANYNVDDESMNIDELITSFGWTYEIAGLKDTLYPCETAVNYFNRGPIAAYLQIAEVDLSDYDVVMIMPGRSHKNLLQSEATMHLIRDAVSSGKVVAAWCRGVRLLAKADVISGKRITGHMDYLEEYEAAGATYIPDNPPPVVDGNIITTVRSRYYRTQMCEEIRKAVNRES